MSQTEVALNAGIQIQQYQICAVLELDPYEFAFGNDMDWVKKTR